MKLGFIGLGIMGKPMASRLLKVGHELTVYNRTKSKMQDLLNQGANGTDSPAEVAEKSDIVITMLSNGPDVEEVVLGEKGVLTKAKPGMILIDMSSINPHVSENISKKCEVHQVKLLDAPVSGGEIGAIEGSLSIMVGGDEETFNLVKEDILMNLGSSAIYCGSIGSGNITKLANQIIVAGNIAILAEALAFSKRANLDPEIVVNDIKNGLAGSRVLDMKSQNIISHDFKPGSKIDLHLKDINNALSFGDQISTDLPITNLVHGMLKKLVEEGYGSYDHSSLSLNYDL